MVPPSKKRKVAPTTGPEPKRNKNTAKPSKQQSTGKKNAPKKNAKGKKEGTRKAAVVDVSALAWQLVGEDFGGLEVIEGVDVVKQGDSVQFVAATTPTTSESEDSKNKNKSKSKGESKGESDNSDIDIDIDNDEQDEDADAENQYGEEDSFEGFGEEVADVQVPHAASAASNPGGLESEGHPQETPGEKGGKAGKKGGKAKKEDQPKPQQQQEHKQSSKGPANSRQSDGLAAPKSKVRESAPSVGNSFDALANIADAEEDDDLDMSAWVALDLSPRILSAIAKLGFPKPTVIQRKSIPQIVAGEDVIGKAQTGSGKTLAFGIPIVEKWLELNDGDDEGKQEAGGSDEEEDKASTKKPPIAVVLSPTRELAKQLGDHFKALCQTLTKAPYICVVTGGLSIHKQQRQLARADIIIGTPGRLWEVLEGDLALQQKLTRINFLVVDEADRLFKAGQFKEVEDIIGALDGGDPEAEVQGVPDDDIEDLPPRQTLVFSATFDKDLQAKLAGRGKTKPTNGDEDQMAYLMKKLKFRSEPKFIDANPITRMADGLKEGLIECGAMEKDLYLYTVLLLNPGRRTLVFTNSISAVRRLVPFLTNLGLGALPIHSQMAQKARMRSLERFTAIKDAILVATDVAARGLDIKNVDQVLHYHVPRAADTYIHRSGRTARGEGGVGISVILCSPEEVLPTRRLAGRVHAKRPGSRREHVIQSLPIDRKVAARLKPRVSLSKRLADTVLAKEKNHGDEAWLRTAADDLGVEYEAGDFEEATPNGWGGRGGGRMRKEKEARSLTKAEVGALRAQLREELSHRVNMGVSEKYITGGRVDIGALLREREELGGGGVFLGGDGLGLGF